MFPAPLRVSRRPGGPGSRIMLVMSSAYLEPVLGWYAACARDLPWRAPGVSAVGGAGQRDHAAADAGEPGPARLPGLARTVADARGARRRSGRRGRAAVGAARLPAPGAAPARDRHDRDRAARRPDPVDPRRAAGAAGDRRVHRRRRRRFRVRPQARGPRHERPARPDPAGIRAASSPAPQPSTAEYRFAESLLPPDPAIAARWSVAVMELGALTCTAASPRCDGCPVAAQCAWLAAGRPAAEVQARRPALRGHRPAVPRPPARRPAGLARAGGARPLRPRLAR